MIIRVYQKLVVDITREAEGLPKKQDRKDYFNNAAVNRLRRTFRRNKRHLAMEIPQDFCSIWSPPLCDNFSRQMAISRHSSRIWTFSYLISLLVSRLALFFIGPLSKTHLWRPYRPQNTTLWLPDSAAFGSAFHSSNTSLSPS